MNFVPRRGRRAADRLCDRERRLDTTRVARLVADGPGAVAVVVGVDARGAVPEGRDEVDPATPAAGGADVRSTTTTAPVPAGATATAAGVDVADRATATGTAGAEAPGGAVGHTRVAARDTAGTARGLRARAAASGAAPVSAGCRAPDLVRTALATTAVRGVGERTAAATATRNRGAVGEWCHPGGCRWRHRHRHRPRCSRLRSRCRPVRPVEAAGPADAVARGVTAAAADVHLQRLARQDLEVAADLAAQATGRAVAAAETTLGADEVVGHAVHVVGDDEVV
ncbi:MAG: hypothetical protein U0W40_02330 [Acidimicrobiia bacterium]